MANPVLNPQLQEYGAGDALALALKIYAGLVMTAYETRCVAGRYVWKKPITEGKTVQFPATWKMTAEEHDAGAALVGNNEPTTEERLIAVDTKEIVAHAFVDTVQEFIAHYDTKAERAVQSARAIARVVDSRLLRVAVLGARQTTAGRGEFPAGNILTAPRATPITTAYPVSLAGSQALQYDLAEIAQKMDEKNVPTENRVCIMGPYLHRVLRQDKTLESADFQSANDMLTRKLILCEGFAIEQSNNMPTTLVAGETNANYNGDFTTTAAVCLGDTTAFGQVSFGGIDAFGPDWINLNRAWLIGAAFLQGCNWLRPEALGEIQIA